MKYLSEDEIEKFVNELVQWKKNRDQDWDYIEKHLHYSDTFNELRDEDEETFFYYKAIFLEKAKLRIQKESTRKGISTKKENWFWIDSLQRAAHWKAFTQMQSNWSKSRMETVSKQSAEIVNCLSNPTKLDTSSEDATVKGLVYGNVQSGKTAHIAALIAMYASSGCNLIIVFSGVTKNLRLQTQDRLRHDLGIDEKGCYDLITANSDLLGKYEQNIQGRLNGNKPCIGVFKKSPAALKRLSAYLDKVNDKSFWNKRQILVIDDECDQYSINVKDMYKDDETGENFERSTINNCIVKILNTFERYCYVGFTATPFANVLNERPGKDSLYPKDFIYPLDMNEKYYGAKKLFGSALSNPEKPELSMNAINIINDEDVNPRMNSFEDLPKSMQEAVIYFILGTACKYYRGIKDHSSMLVHLDMKIAVHFQLKKIFDAYFKNILCNYKSLKESFEEIWNKEKDKISFETVKSLFSYCDEDKEKYPVPDFSELQVYINEVINKLKVVVDNSATKEEDRLHYDDDKSNVYIVIGGNTLSRGLTLEGLLVSIFYRTNSLYDTLLQMGRWFGYRIGYEDLARVYTTKKIAFKYSELADIEDELREEFSNYTFDTTPEEVSVKIRTLPSLQITRKMAMQSAKSTGINYSGHRPQTLFFPRFDKEWLLHNQKVTYDFLSSLGEYSIKNRMPLFENIPADKIAEYIKALNICEENKTCHKELLLKFFAKAKKRNFLNTWNVVVLSNSSGNQFEISKNLTVNLIERSRYDRKDPEEKNLYLKVLQQPTNMLLDTDLCDSTKDTESIPSMFLKRHAYFAEKGIKEPGLLLIYPINKDSKPKAGSSNRLPLNSQEHIIAHTFVFPNSKDILLDNYMTIDLEREFDYAD